MPHKKITDLQKAFHKLKSKAELYNQLFDYYDGRQTLKYNRKRFQDIFKALDVDFTENWTAVVIDACYNRVNLVGVKIAGDEKETEGTGVLAAIKRMAERMFGRSTTEQAKLDALLEQNELLLDSDDVHRVAGIIGESFYIVWKNEDGEVVGFYNDPRRVHLFYDEENSRKKKFAAKWWIDEQHRRRLTLYYPDRLEFYISRGKAKDVHSATAFVPVNDEGELVGEGENIAENPFDQIPIFHFRPERRKIKSDLTNVIAPQDAINKLASDMMIGSEFGALMQRWVISSADDLGKLKNAANEIWVIPSGDGEGEGTSVGQFESNDPVIHLKPIMHNISAISSITSTPSHFFFEGGKSSISGEALIALEAPLNDKARTRIDLFTPVWRQVISFMLKVSGSEVDPENVIINFEPPETLQPLTRSKIREIDRRSGIPLITTLRREGWTETEIDQLIIEQDEERQRNQASLGVALLNARRDFDNPEGEDEDEE